MNRSLIRSRRRSLLVPVPLAVAVMVGLGTTPAHADLSQRVIAAFKGKILVSAGPLEAAGDDKATIAKFKKEALTVVTGAANVEDATEWNFEYMAFLKQRGGSTLRLEFHDGKKYVADKTLSGIEPSLTVLEGDIAINEDDGLVKGRTYTLKLVATAGTKEVVLATSSLTMN